MTIRGIVQHDGSIALERSSRLPPGTPVSVRPLGRSVRTTPKRKLTPSIHDLIAPFIGKAKGVPSDIADEHDHYLYGTPRRK